MQRVLQIHLHSENHNQLKDELKNSIILEFDQPVGLGDLLASIPSGSEWGDGLIEAGKFLLRAPTTWRRQAIIKGEVELAGCTFKVTRNVDEVSLQSEWRRVWVRLLGLPYELRGEDTIARLVQTFGTFIEIDYNTKHNLDLRWARVSGSVADYTSIPPYIPLDVLNNRKEKFEMDIHVEEETPFFEPLIDLSNVLDPDFNPLPILRTNTGSGVSNVPPGFEYRLPTCGTIPCQDAPPLGSIDPPPQHDAVYGNMFHGEEALFLTDDVMDYLCGPPLNLHKADGAGTSAVPLRDVNASTLGNDFGMLSNENAIGPEQILAGAVVERAALSNTKCKKRKSKWKACASKRRIDFTGRMHHDSAGNAQTSDVVKTGHSASPSHALCITPGNVPYVPRSSVRLACMKMQKARDQRQQKGGTWSADVDVVVVDEDDELSKEPNTA